MTNQAATEWTEANCTECGVRIYLASPDEQGTLCDDCGTDAQLAADSDALDGIAQLLDGTEWTSDVFAAVAEMIRATGREIRDHFWADAPEEITAGCDACGAEPGEECRPMCIGQAAAMDAAGIDLTEEEA